MIYTELSHTYFCANLFFSRKFENEGGEGKEIVGVKSKKRETK